MSLAYVQHVGRFLLATGCFFATFGCRGEEVYQLSGNVTYKNQPVPAGNIVFEPDSKKGNKGASGMAKIRDGKYDTRDPDSKGTIGGPHVVRIVGIDGKESGDASGEILPGRPLFPEYSVEVDLPQENGTHDFEIPGT